MSTLRTPFSLDSLTVLVVTNSTTRRTTTSFHYMTWRAITMFLVLSLTSRRSTTAFTSSVVVRRFPSTATLSVATGHRVTTTGSTKVRWTAAASFSTTSTTASGSATTTSDTGSEPLVKELPVEYTMEEIVSLCKRRGIIFPSSEIYNGYAGFYDYGPLGCEIKKNIKDAWWKFFVTNREDVVGVDSSIIHNPQTWKSSGKRVVFFFPSSTPAHEMKVG